MPLTEQEEFELLSLEREKAMSGQQQQSITPPSPTSTATAEQPSFMKQLGQSSVNTIGNLIGGIIQPPAKVVGRGGMAIESAISGQPMQPYTLPLAPIYGGNIDISPTKSLSQGMGPALQTIAMMLKGPTLSGAMYGAGQGMDQQNNGLEIAGKAALGGILGKLLNTVMGKPFIPKSTTNYINKLKNKVTPQEELQNLRWNKTDVLKENREALNVLETTDKALTKTISNNIDESVTKLNTEIPKTAIKVQQELPTFFRNNSKAYGSRLDNISDDLSSTMNYVTRDEVADIYNNTVNELYDMGIDEGPTLFMIKNTQKKYQIPYESEMGQQSITKANEEVNFKDFIVEFRKIRDTLSATAKAGQRYAPEDISSAVLQKNVGEWVGQKVPEFKQLQQEYQPIVQAMKEAGKLFKPYAGKFTNINGANSLLKRMAIGKATPQDTALIDLVENGSNFAPGVGKITEGIKKSGVVLNEYKKALKYEKDFYQKTKNSIGELKQPELDKIELRQREITTQLLRKSRVDDIRNKTMTGLSILGGGAYGVYLLKKLISLKE